MLHPLVKEQIGTIIKPSEFEIPLTDLDPQEYALILNLAAMNPFEDGIVIDQGMLKVNKLEISPTTYASLDLNALSARRNQLTPKKFAL
jgi:hypothetical protein